MKKPAKKMQAGGSLKPTYKNLGLARSASNNAAGRDTNTPATKKDSLDYKKGFDMGKAGKKPSALRAKYEGKNQYEEKGRWEGQNSTKTKTMKKAKMGASLKTPDNPGLKKLPTPVRNKMGFKKNGGVMMAKNGKSFPDLNKDGKITKADILKGRGVIAQKGATVKKKTGMDAVKAVGKYVSTFGGATERDNPKQKDINIVKKLKETGTKVKNKLGLKSGGTVKKCKYGCK